MYVHTVKGKKTSCKIVCLIRFHSFKSSKYLKILYICIYMCLLSCVQLFATPRTAAYQAPPSIAFSRQEYWSGWPVPSPHLAWTPSKAPPHSGRGLYFLIFQSPLLFSLWLFSHLLLTIAALGASIQDLTGVHCFIPSLSSYSPFDLKCPFPTYVSLLKSRECFVHQDPITLGRFCLSSHSIFAHFTFS